MQPRHCVCLIWTFNQEDCNTEGSGVSISIGDAGIQAMGQTQATGEPEDRNKQFKAIQIAMCTTEFFILLFFDIFHYIDFIFLFINLYAFLLFVITSLIVQ